MFFEPVLVFMSHVPPYLEKLVDLAQVYSLLGIQFVDVAAVSIHEVQAEAHHLEKRRAVVTLCTALWFKTTSAASLTLSSMCFSLGVRYSLLS